ncbi:MAG: ComEC/Rec2 family competence protein [Candidatus Liptonbacteria bacterium]|nr:ComEC/Rec2 family competence protein [Candidatus Liptonbacteria bacterium]
MPIADIAFYGALSFIGGTLAVGFELPAIWTVLFFAAAISVFSLMGKWGWKEFFFILFLFAFGIFYYNFFFNLKESSQKIIFGENIGFSGVVSKEPQLSEKFQRLTVELRPPLAGKISVLVSLSPEINYGDVIEATGEIKSAASKNQEPISFFPKFKIAVRHQGSLIKEKLLGFKKSVIFQFKRFLPDDSAALLSGLTLGWRGDFTDEFKKEMSLSGTTHLVALSGYNITILVLVVAGAFEYWLARRMTFWLTTAVICLFIVMVGAEASVVRAALMGFLVLVAKEVGRRHSLRNAIALTAATMVFVDPSALFDIGFQLSFLSLLGIVYLRPALSVLFRIKDDSKSFLSWRENALTTLSAQLAVIPVLIQVFGNFSLTSIAANVLILEFVPLTMLFGFLLAAFGSIFYYAGFVLSFLENIFLKYELGVIKLFADWSMPVFSGANSWFLFTIYYLTIIIFVTYMAKPKNAE